MRAEHRPVTLQMRVGERQQDQKDACPSKTGECQWRHVACDMAREHDIARPEQRGQAEKQIGLVIEPAERRAVCWFAGQCTPFASEAMAAARRKSGWRPCAGTQPRAPG